MSVRIYVCMYTHVYKCVYACVSVCVYFSKRFLNLAPFLQTEDWLYICKKIESTQTNHLLTYDTLIHSLDNGMGPLSLALSHLLKSMGRIHEQLVYDNEKTNHS